MLVEIGHFALILALVFAVLQVVLPTLGLMRANFALSQLSRPLLWMQFFWIIVSFAVLMNAFIIDDFSVKYVANNSNTELPTIFLIKFCFPLFLFRLSFFLSFQRFQIKFFL